MQLPETLLPSELRWKVQSFLRTPTAELIRDVADNHEKDKWQAVRNVIHMTNGDLDRVTGLIRGLEECYTLQGYVLSHNRLLTVVSEGSVSDTDSHPSLDSS